MEILIQGHRHLLAALADLALCLPALSADPVPMSYAERFPSRHPMCHCPELTFTNGPEVSAANKECREASRGITHPVVTLEDILEFRERMAR